MSSEDYFQRLTAGATFSRTFNIFTKRLDIFLRISLLVFVPLVAMNITLLTYIGSSMQTFMDTMDISNRYLQYDNNNYEPPTTYDTYNIDNTNQDYSNLNNNYQASQESSQEEIANEFLQQLIANFGKIAIQIFLEMLVFFVFAIAAEAAIIYSVGQIYVDHNPRVSECLKKGFSKWCTLFGASLLVLVSYFIGNFVFGFISGFLLQISKFFGVVVFGGSIAWIIFIIYFFVSLIILGPAIVIENFGPVDAIKRAWDLSQNNRCYIFCTLFCFATIYNVLIMVINGVISGVAGREAVFGAWGVFFSMLPSIVYLPLSFM